MDIILLAAFLSYLFTSSFDNFLFLPRHNPPHSATTTCRLPIYHKWYRFKPTPICSSHPKATCLMSVRL
ncbi:hypothetical protein Hanom_Chr17g01556271 [Helianthus anomalus]